MRVKAVTLENVRSHVDSRIEFKKGFNCLVGGLGTGKSSVLYAIDFALFGDPLTRSYNYLLREGESAGKVVVEFLLNGKTYRVERGLKKRGKSISQDAECLNLYEEDRLLASMRNEAVEEQLKAITGLDKDTFREVVWVRQEHLKELLDAAPRQRQIRLDQLFGLSDYELAWNNLRDVEKEYETERKVYEKDYDVVGIEKLEAEYHDTLREFASADNEIAEQKGRMQHAETTLQTASSRLDGLEELRQQTEQLLRKEAEMQTHITNTEGNCARLVEDVARKEKAVREYERRLADLESQVKTQRTHLEKIDLEPDLTVEALRTKLDSYDTQITSLRAEQEATRKEHRASRQRASELEAESKCPLCLQPLTADYKTHMLEHIEKDYRDGHVRLEKLQAQINELETLRTTVRTVSSNLQSHLPQLDTLKERIAEELESRERLEKERQTQQAQGKSLQSQLESLHREIARFDVGQLEKAREHYDTSLKQYHSAQAKLESTEERRKGLALRVEDFRDRLEHAQAKLDKVQKIETLLEIVTGIRDAYRSIQPKLRTEFVRILERVVQQVLDSLLGEEGSPLFASIDDTYTPSVKSQEGYERDVSLISGGERTILAFAYRFALGQLIMQARTGHGLHMLLLDEPTESLGREDHSVDRLAEAIARLKSIEQILAVTHNEVFAEKAEHVIRLEKEAAVSKAFVGN